MGESYTSDEHISNALFKTDRVYGSHSLAKEHLFVSLMSAALDLE